MDAGDQRANCYLLVLGAYNKEVRVKSVRCGHDRTAQDGESSECTELCCDAWLRTAIGLSKWL